MAKVLWIIIENLFVVEFFKLSSYDLICGLSLLHRLFSWNALTVQIHNLTLIIPSLLAIKDDLKFSVHFILFSTVSEIHIDGRPLKH
jgi:uncharacterized membrane protein YfhO